jgi:hypothetical protein
MSEGADAIAVRLRRLLEAGSRGRLLAKGLARSLIWRDGEVPHGAQELSPALSFDLPDHGCLPIALALRLRDKAKCAISPIAPCSPGQRRSSPSSAAATSPIPCAVFTLSSLRPRTTSRGTQLGCTAFCRYLSIASTSLRRNKRLLSSCVALFAVSANTVRLAAESGP